MVTAKQFIDMCIIPYREGWGYIYGQWGATWTKGQVRNAVGKGWITAEEYALITGEQY